MNFERKSGNSRRKRNRKKKKVLPLRQIFSTKQPLSLMTPNFSNCISMDLINMLAKLMIDLSMKSSWRVIQTHIHSSLRFMRSTILALQSLYLVILLTNTWNESKSMIKRLKTFGKLSSPKRLKMRSAAERKVSERLSDLKRLKAVEIHHNLILVNTPATITWMIWTTTACLTQVTPSLIRSVRPKNSTLTLTSRSARKSIESRCLRTRTATKSVRTLPRRTSFHVSCKLN